MLNVHMLDNGNIRVSLDDGAGEWLNEMEENKNNDELFLTEGLEAYWTNGHFHPFDAGAGRPFVGLTEAPCIALHMDYDENGEPYCDEFWVYPNYAVRSVFDEIRLNGSVVFVKA